MIAQFCAVPSSSRDDDLSFKHLRAVCISSILMEDTPPQLAPLFDEARIKSCCRQDDVSFEHQSLLRSNDVPCNHFKETADMVSPETRFPELSYSHHREIAPLPPEEQKCF